MIAEAQEMRREATALQQAFVAIGCPFPVRLIDHDQGIRIDSYTDGFMLIRHADDQWQVLAQTPCYTCTRTFANAIDCAREIALCQVGYVYDQTEERINAALRKAMWN